MRWSVLAVASAVGAFAVFSCNDPQQPSNSSRDGQRPVLALTGAAASGSWSAPFSWPIVAAHMSVLPDGRVISWVSSDTPGDTEQREVHVWNPSTGAFTDLSNSTNNVFCSANTFLPDGRLLVAGGHIADNKGI